MDNGVYIALSRQTGLFRKMDMVANNIANVDTTGFQSENIMFTDYLVGDGNHRKMAFTQDIASYRNTQGGPLKVTGNTLDFAIQGNGYFSIETAQGTRYSKAGNFQLDGNGVLVNSEGFPVLDDAGQRIEFAEDDQNIVVGEAGNISVNGEERAVIGVVEFANEQKMTQEFGTLLRTDEAPIPNENSRVLQGVLEKSNSEPVLQLVEMLKTTRAVGNTAKYIEVMYDLQRKANNAYAQNSG